MKKISVLFVCLGNICRSPAAEAIFINLLERKGLRDGFIVDSAGTGSWHTGKKADSRMRIAAERRNINILSRARQITVKDFEDSNREISPLLKANDAIEIITDGYSISEVVDKIVDLYNDKIPKETQIH